MPADARFSADLSTLPKRDQIDVICDAFEAEWIEGSQPDIRGFLGYVERVSQCALFRELLLVDCEYRKRAGGFLSKSDLLNTHPEFAEQIEAISFELALDSTTPHSSTETLFDELQIGSKIGRFELIEKVGAGAAGEVWKAKDGRLQRFVALKTPRNRRLSDDEVRRFLREGQATAQLKHENIVGVYEVGRSKGFAFIVSEFVFGSDLRGKLQTGPLNSRTAAEICAKLADALHHAHEHGVIHRDFKPANVLIDENDNPKVADFGLAKWSEDVTEMTLGGQLLGTPAYMSPEQARGGASTVDSRTDIYSLGVVLFEMLTGRLPFTGNHDSLLSIVIEEVPPSPRSISSSLPKDLETICLKCLEKDPKHRYRSAQELAVDLKRYLKGEAILARRTGPLEKSWRWCRRKPAVAAALALACVAACTAATAIMLANENHSLQGYQTIAITTEPPGAKIAFVPLSDDTGEPLPERVAFPKSRTPVETSLLPGNYFIVAVLPDGRFHEVFRHVPSKENLIPQAYPQQSFKVLPDESIELTKIKIPAANVAAGMAFVQGASTFAMGTHGSKSIPEHQRAVASYFIDTAEFTIGEYISVHKRRPSRYKNDPRPDDWPISVSFDLAAYTAEELGKRLPYEHEYEYAATALGYNRYPWGNDLPSKQVYSFGPVREPPFDKLPTSPPIFGLCSGFAEWTLSYASAYPPGPGNASGLPLTAFRMVRGGSTETIEENTRNTYILADPKSRTAVLRYSTQPQLGFRCVRSFKPLFSYDDIP